MFDTSISRETLENYLARAVTHAGLCSSSADPMTDSLDDDIRMLLTIGAKFVGRTAFVWALSEDDERHFRQTQAAAAKVHDADPEIILQACIFEAIFPGVEAIPVPDWVFHEFGLPVEKRTFDYEAMLYKDNRMVDQWGAGGSVPDMSQLETRLWFYYRCRRYIDAGIEALHFGQVMIMDDADPGHRHWIDLLNRVRVYAKTNARRHLVLCDAHTHGEVEDGKLLFDFHSFPLRIAERPGKPQEAILSRDHSNNLFGHSKGGITPSGWSCESLPYLVEFDNWGYSGKGGESVGVGPATAERRHLEVREVAPRRVLLEVGGLKVRVPEQEVPALVVVARRGGLVVGHVQRLGEGVLEETRTEEVVVVEPADTPPAVRVVPHGLPARQHHVCAEVRKLADAGLVGEQIDRRAASQRPQPR